MIQFTCDRCGAKLETMLIREEWMIEPVEIVKHPYHISYGEVVRSSTPIKDGMGNHSVCKVCYDSFVVNFESWFNNIKVD
jgi:hypothetical protein